jgi:hypothetical protein
MHHRHSPLLSTRVFASCFVRDIKIVFVFCNRTLFSLLPQKLQRKPTKAKDHEVSIDSTKSACDIEARDASFCFAAG